MQVDKSNVIGPPISKIECITGSLQDQKVIQTHGSSIQNLTTICGLNYLKRNQNSLEESSPKQSV